MKKLLFLILICCLFSCIESESEMTRKEVMDAHEECLKREFVPFSYVNIYNEIKKVNCFSKEGYDIYVKKYRE